MVRRQKRNSRALVSVALLIADLVILTLTVADVHGPLRYVLGLVLGLVIPGWSVVGLLSLADVALEIGLTLSVSVALVMVAAQIMVTVHAWHPVALEELTCVLCLPSLVLQSRIVSWPWRLFR